MRVAKLTLCDTIDISPSHSPLIKTAFNGGF